MKQINIIPTFNINRIGNIKNVNQLCKDLKINRGTFYQWQKLESFQAAYNQLNEELKQNTKTNIIQLHDEALKTVRDVLKSDNENVKLKAAFYIIDKIENIRIGETDLQTRINNKNMLEALEFSL